MSKFGDVLFSIAIGIYIYRKTDSESMMAIFTSLSMFVTFFLSPLSGAIVDRINRKWIVSGSGLVRGLLMITIGVLSIRAQLTTATLFVLAVLAALATVLFQPAASTILLDVVPKDEYVRASSITSSFTGVMDMISKGISGFLLVKFGIGQLIIFNGFIFLVSAVCGYFIKVPLTPKQGKGLNFQVTINDLIEGLKTIINTQGLNAFFALAILINLFSAGPVGLFYLLAAEKGFNIEQYGFLMFMMSLGSFLGALPTSLLKIKAQWRPLVMISSFLLGGVLMVLGLMSNSVQIVAIGLLLGEFFTIVGNMILNSTIVILIPADKRATILGFISASGMGGYALSTLIYGWLAESFSITRLAVAGTIIGTIIIMLLFLNRYLMQEVVNSGYTDEEKAAKGKYK